MSIKPASWYIGHLQLYPHPEGGYYKEVFRSELQVFREGSTELRKACTSIYYLLEGRDFSGFHRLESDELWYFHKGAPLLIHVMDEDGSYSKIELSDEVTGNLSAAIKAGLWFASEIPLKKDFALVSCAVAPGFEFSGFEMADRAEMITKYPQHSELLRRLCR